MQEGGGISISTTIAPQDRRGNHKDMSTKLEVWAMGPSKQPK